MNVLFVCSLHRLRSPNAEQVFANWPGCNTRSAGTAYGADEPVTPKVLEWAELIFAMEKAHHENLVRKFSSKLKGKRIITLNIRDKYDFMDRRLVRILKTKVVKLLPARRDARSA